MRLDFIDLGKLSISKANMRYAKKAPDVSDILPTVRARGVLVPLIVRPNCAEGAYEIVAGARRFTAACLVAGEKGEADPLPCAILEEGDDAAALEASLIENVARRDADEVTQWETYTRLITKEGRSIGDIAGTFGMPEPMVRRILALGNLLPRVRSLYAKEKISSGTVRHLTMASKTQQRAWLALFDDPATYCPQGHQLKGWLFGGGAIRVEHALFDVEASGLAVIADLFGDERYFGDSDGFWTAQLAAVEERRAQFLDDGWSDVVVLPKGEYFRNWEFRQAAKRKGGRVYIEVRDTGEIDIHEGYVTAKEAARLEKGEKIDAAPKAARPELTTRMQTYIDLHRHAAVRAALTGHPAVALRLLVAHAVAGSPLWNVKVEPQTTKDDDVRESVEVSRAETVFDEKRRAVLALLGFDAEEPSVTGGNPMRLVHLFQRLLDLPDRAVMDVIAIVIGETLFAGSAAVEAVGLHIGLDMAAWWSADDALFEGVRDKEVLTALVAEVGGEEVAAANAKEKGATLKAIIRDHLDGSNGRAKVAAWVPKWMAFPPAAYTARGGVGTVAAHRELAPPEVEAVPEIEADPEIGANSEAGREAGAERDQDAELDAEPGPGIDVAPQSEGEKQRKAA